MKKLMRKLLAAVAAMTMVLGMSGLTAFAAGAGNDGTITVDNAVNGEKYQLYKVFDATVVDGRATNDANGIRYTVPDGKTLAADNAWFSVDAAGNVTAKEGAGNALSSDAFKTWVENFGTKIGEVKTAADGNVKWTDLSDGYYYITTTTGSLVTVTSIAPNATVKEKNTVSAVDDKKATAVEQNKGSVNTDTNDNKTAGHLVVAEVGSTVDFTATVKLGKGAKNVKFHDTMSEGLKLVADSIQVQNLPEGVTSTTRADATGANAHDNGDTFTIDFSGNVSADTTVTITYKATVTSDTLTQDAATNRAHITYGDQNTATPDKEVDVYNAKITVDKTIAGLTDDKKLTDGDEAQFVLKNSESKYYKYTAATATTDAKVEWVSNLDDATKLSFNSAHDSKAFTGLANGNYTVVESNVPKGYIKATDKEITINNANITVQANREQTYSVTNNQGTSLPSTGGIGTTIFYILGAILVLGAGVVLVTRRRLSK